MSKKEPTFAELMKAVPKKEAATFTVDMSRFFAQAADSEPVEFTFRRLGVNQIFGLQEVVEVIKNQRPEWSERLCLEVAGMCVCHQLPAPENGNRDSLIHLYCALFSNADDADLFALIQEFGAKAGADFLNKAEQKVNKAKKN